MVKKIIGYVLSIIGLIGVAAFTVPQVKTALSFLEPIGDMPLIISSAVLIIIGIFLIMKSSGSKMKKGQEVPIFKGKEVIGYRRT